MRRLGVLVTLVTLAACTIERRVDRAEEVAVDSTASEFLRPWGDSAPPAGVRSGDLVWIWAMAGTVPGSVPPSLVPGGIRAEARQALDNIVAVMASAGATARDVAQCSAFLADAADATALMEVYAEYFPAPPQRVGVALAPLALGARVEIECTAVVPAAP